VIVNLAGTLTWVGRDLVEVGVEVGVVAAGVVPAPEVSPAPPVAGVLVVPAVPAGDELVVPGCVDGAGGVVTAFACGELLELLEEPPQPPSNTRGISPRANRGTLTLPA
jgi:hypothetical protein